MSSHRAPTQALDRPKLALAGTVIIFAAVLVALTYISEPPLTVVPRPKPVAPQHTRAAVAIRDFADPYQQWGSLLFALPVLKQGYKHVTYINQRSDTDQEGHLIRALKRSLGKYDHTDLFLLAHGSNRYIKLIEKHIHRRLTRRLRLVYNTGCGNAKQGPKWQALGVEAYVGHGGAISISPVFFFYFLRRWTQGYHLRQAIHEANWYTQHHLMLVGKLSFGLLNGPTLVGDTKAQLFGNGDVQIYPPDAPELLSSAQKPHIHAPATPQPPSDDEEGAFAPKPQPQLPN